MLINLRKEMGEKDKIITEKKSKLQSVQGRISFKENSARK